MVHRVWRFSASRGLGLEQQVEVASGLALFFACSIVWFHCIYGPLEYDVAVRGRLAMRPRHRSSLFRPLLFGNSRFTRFTRSRGIAGKYTQKIISSFVVFTSLTYVLPAKLHTMHPRTKDSSGSSTEWVGLGYIVRFPSGWVGLHIPSY